MPPWLASRASSYCRKAAASRGHGQPDLRRREAAYGRQRAGLKALGVKPLARIHHMTRVGHDPVIMLEAPIPATKRALKKAGMKIGDIDLYEVNEAFAPVRLAWLRHRRRSGSR